MWLVTNLAKNHSRLVTESHETCDQTSYQRFTEVLLFAKSFAHSKADDQEREVSLEVNLMSPLTNG